MKSFRFSRVDMLNGPILKNILLFSLPIFLGSVFQQLYNMVDSVVVGKYVSANALAAVGSTGTLTMMLVGIMMGFPTGASVVAAQFAGAGERDKIKRTISTSLYFLLALSVVLTVVGLLLARRIMGWVNVPEEVLPDALGRPCCALTGGALKRASELAGDGGFTLWLTITHEAGMAAATAIVEGGVWRVE